MPFHLHLHSLFNLAVNFQKLPRWLLREQSHALLKRCHLNHNLHTLLSVTWAQLYFSAFVYIYLGGGTTLQ